jgi:hypothetical protein
LRGRVCLGWGEEERGTVRQTSRKVERRKKEREKKKERRMRKDNAEAQRTQRFAEEEKRKQRPRYKLRAWGTRRKGGHGIRITRLLLRKTTNRSPGNSFTLWIDFARGFTLSNSIAARNGWNTTKSIKPLRPSPRHRTRYSSATKQPRKRSCFSISR